MASAPIINNTSKRNLQHEDFQTLKDSLLGLTALNQDIVLLDYSHVLIRRNYKELKSVRLLSGGLAGKDLCHAMLVGKGMLTAAILGEEATPPSRTILRTLKELNEGENCGIFVICIPNSDMFNFGLAVERFSADCHKRIKLLSIDDDKLKNKEHNACGFIMLTKIIGAMAEGGDFFSDIWECYKKIVKLIISVPLNYMYEDASTSVRRKSVRLTTDFESTFRFIIDTESQSALNLHPSVPTVVLINTSKDLERNAELGLVKQVVERLRQLGICTIRIYLGNFVSASSGSASLTVMKVHDNKLIGYLDAPCEAPAWRNFTQFLPEVTIYNEIPGLLVKQAKEPVALKGPKLSESQISILVKSVQFACEALISCERQLNIIDGERSAGNVGSRLRMLAECLLGKLNKKRFDRHCPYAFLKRLSVISEIMIGGTMGSIYGMMFESAANVFGESPDQPVTALLWTQALTAAVETTRRYCRNKMELTTMYFPVKVCQMIASADLNIKTNFMDTYGLAVAKAEEAAQKTRDGNHKYSDAGAHAVGIWMRAIYEGVKLMCAGEVGCEKITE